MMTAVFGTTVNSVAASTIPSTTGYSEKEYADFKKSVEGNDLFRYCSNNIVSLPQGSSGNNYLSHAAYLMYSYGIPKDDLFKIWRGSLSEFGSIYELASFRKAVTKSLLYNRAFDETKKVDYLEKINSAFDSVHIFTESKYFTYPNAWTGITQGKAFSSMNMKKFVITESQKYRYGYRWSTDNIEACVPNSAGKTDVENGITIGPTYYNGYDITYDYEHQEAYFACAGFARKLQIDYFGTNKYLQLTEKDGFKYEPRIGDHLRIKSIGGHSGPGCEHSVFITSVTDNGSSGYSISYADCNKEAKNEIAWNRTGKISRDRYGNLDIILDGTARNFIWVERPVMIGDANGDSIIDDKDISAIDVPLYRTQTRNVANQLRTYACDVNQDGLLTWSDKDLLVKRINSSGYLSENNFVR